MSDDAPEHLYLGSLPEDAQDDGQPAEEAPAAEPDPAAGALEHGSELSSNPTSSVILNWAKSYRSDDEAASSSATSGNVTPRKDPSRVRSHYYFQLAPTRRLPVGGKPRAVGVRRRGKPMKRRARKPARRPPAKRRKPRSTSPSSVSSCSSKPPESISTAVAKMMSGKRKIKKPKRH